MKTTFNIGDIVEITKYSNLKGAKGKVVNYGRVHGGMEYLVRLERSDEHELGGGDFWFKEFSLKKV